MSAHILVVDDDDSMLDVLSDVLSADGYLVTASRTALDPLQVAELGPDVLIIDLRLEDGPFGGWEMVRRMKTDLALAALPIIVISADVVALRAHAAEAAHMQGVLTLTKPFTLERLKMVLQASLRADEDGDAEMVPTAIAYSSELT